MSRLSNAKLKVEATALTFDIFLSPPPVFSTIMISLRSGPSESEGVWAAIFVCESLSMALDNFSIAGNAENMSFSSTPSIKPSLIEADVTAIQSPP